MRRILSIALAGTLGIFTAGTSAERQNRVQSLTTLSGVVADAETGRPVPGAFVYFTIESGLAEFDKQKPSTTANDAGEFTLTDVPLAYGRLRARKEGYQEGAFGARWATQSAGYLDVGRGPHTQLAIPMWRGGSIHGTVFDERNRSLENVPVHAWLKDDPEARQWEGKTGTDGGYRIDGLPAGDFIVGLNITHKTRKPGHNDDDRPCPAAVAFCSELSAPFERPASSDGSATYASMLYPGARDTASAVPIAVRVGEQRAGINFQLRPTPGARVTGKLVSRADASYPIAFYVWLYPDDRQPEALPAAIGILDWNTNAFTLLDVPPGRYTLLAATKSKTTPTPAVFETRAWIDVPIQGIDGVEVDLAESTDVVGKIVFRGKKAPPSYAVVTMWALRTHENTGNSGVTGDDGIIEIGGVLPGKYAITRLSVGDGYEVESMTASGRDLTREPLDVRAGGVRDLVVTLSDSLGTVGLSVVDADGNQLQRAGVAIFPAEPSTWAHLDDHMPGVVSTGPRTGKMSVPLPSGEYLAAAVRPRDFEHWPSEPLIRKLAVRAARFKVSAGTSQQLVLALPRDNSGKR